MMHRFIMLGYCDTATGENIPNKEWMENLGKTFYFIWKPQTKTRNYYEVAKGTLGRGQFGDAWIVDCKYVNKPNKAAGWNECIPRHDYYNICEKIDPSITSKFSCLAFDTYEEAQAFCDKYNIFYQAIKNEEEKQILDSEIIKKEIQTKLPAIIDFFNNLKITSRDQLEIIRTTYDKINKTL